MFPLVFCSQYFVWCELIIYHLWTKKCLAIRSILVFRLLCVVVSIAIATHSRSGDFQVVVFDEHYNGWLGYEFPKKYLRFHWNLI